MITIRNLLKINYAKLVAFENSNRKNVSWSCNKNKKRCNNDINSVNYLYVFQSNDSPSCCNTHSIKILSDLMPVFGKSGIEFFGMWGGILGSVRHGGITPLDSDIELVIFKKDKEEFIKTLIEKKLDYDIEVSELVIKINYRKIKKINIDVFVWEEHSDSLYASYKNMKFKLSDFFSLKKLKFYGIELPFPKENNLLKAIYGGDDVFSKVQRKWAFDKSSKDGGFVSKAHIDLNKYYD